MLDQLQTAHARHVDVDDCDVRLGPRDDTQPLVTIACLTDDLRVSGALEGKPDQDSMRRRVIDDHNSKHVLLLSSRRGLDTGKSARGSAPLQLAGCPAARCRIAPDCSIGSSRLPMKE